MLLIAVYEIDGEYKWHLKKYIIVEDDYDYGSQCDDCTTLSLVAELRNVKLEDQRLQRQLNISDDQRDYLEERGVRIALLAEHKFKFDPELKQTLDEQIDFFAETQSAYMQDL